MVSGICVPSSNSGNAFRSLPIIALGASINISLRPYSYELNNRENLARYSWLAVSLEEENI